jgi:hypothetical protein
MAVICTYLLPFRRARFSLREVKELASYFQALADVSCEVLVIDGSPPRVFALNALFLGHVCRHEPVDRRFGYLNDKVNGVHTGLELAASDKIILADDDIHYTPDVIAHVTKLLDEYEVVRPQNFLRPLPWWAKMEMARMLINRATLATADYPGTCAFRRSTIHKTGHYDGDVLFDNEEIIRHFAHNGCRITYGLDLFVQKQPPTLRKWIEQRPRQAYEDFGLRVKTALFFGLLPFLIVVALLAGARGIEACLGVVAIASTLLALQGWARGHAPEVFPFYCCFFAPLWLFERTLSTYWALWFYLTRGGYPFGEHLLSRGIGRAWRSGGRAAARRG